MQQQQQRQQQQRQKVQRHPIRVDCIWYNPSGKPRLFVCQVCTRAFARLEHLRRHERSHKGKPFSCGVCQRKFSRRDLLLRHAQKLHAGCADAITRLRRKSIKKSRMGTMMMTMMTTMKKWQILKTKTIMMNRAMQAQRMVKG